MISRFRMRGLLSFDDVTVDLAPLTVLIGRSGTGKTNLVKAVRALRSLVSPPRNQNFGLEIQEWDRLLPLTNQFASPSFSISVNVPGIDNEFCYELDFHPKHYQGAQIPTVRSERLLMGGASVFHHSDGKWIVEPPIVGVAPPTGVMLNKLHGLPMARIAYQALSRGLGCYDFPGSVLQPAKSPIETGDANDLAADYRNVLDGIFGGPLTMVESNEIVELLRKIDPTVVDLDPRSFPERSTNDDALVSHRARNQPILPIPLGQHSEGFRRFLAHLLMLSQQPSKLTMFFEEPEKGIYPGALSALVDRFEAVTSSGRGQIVLTTHSPQLLDHFSVESIRVVEMEGYATRIGQLAGDQLDAVRKGLLTTGELLTVEEAKREPAVATA